MTPTVLVHLKADGSFDILAHGEVRVVWVDDASPGDRLYEQTDRIGADQVTAILSDDIIGHKGDGKLSENEIQAIRARLNPGLRVAP